MMNSIELLAVVMFTAASPFNQAEESVLFRCAPNTLYVYLVTQEVEVRLEQIDEALEHRESPSSISEMIRVAERFGVKSSARRFTRDQTDEIPFPAIAFIPAQNTGQPGHYVVLLSSDDNLVTLIDGTSGQLKQWHHNTLWRLWQDTGIAIVAEKRDFTILGTSLVVAGSLLCVCLIIRTWSSNSTCHADGVKP